MNPATRVFCTIITKSYVAWARVLHRCLMNLHPGSRFVVFLADHGDGFLDPTSEPYDVLTLESLGEGSTLRRMAFYYTAVEYCCALRPFVLAKILSLPGVEQVLYLDADIFVLSPLDGVWSALDSCSILLSPHCVRPVPPQLDQPSAPLERRFLRYGTFNAGCLGLRRSEQAAAMLTWWRDHLIRECFYKEDGLYLDQLWLNLVPAFFQETKLLRIPGANVAYWNLHEAPLTRSVDGSFRFGEYPLLFLHLSGWDPMTPHSMGKNGVLTDPIQAELWSELGARFAALLARAGWSESQCYPYSFDRYDSGRPISLNARRYYYRELEAGRGYDLDPFQNEAVLQAGMLRDGPGFSARVRRVMGRTLRRLSGSNTSRSR